MYDTIIFKAAFIMLVISNDNSFRVLFDKVGKLLPYIFKIRPLVAEILHILRWGILF